MLRLEYLLDPGQHLEAKRPELGAAMVNGRVAHGSQDAIGNGARPGDLKEVAARGVEVEFLHGLLQLSFEYKIL
ncbi:hypothetical protein OR16_30254 [Cupriavidus basilensis OR16]|uniref:Uncharacterized protein n=1 Tax=Cupriavidus basilensis OR16 TaxID=1127483 RepID=H1SCU2_9BURK|nr:hypothetical protein OR16_30254 [Cupriavidus basilensis OR16]